MATKKKYVVTNCGGGGKLAKAHGLVMLRKYPKSGDRVFQAMPQSEALLWTDNVQEAAIFSTKAAAQAVAGWIAGGGGWCATTVHRLERDPGVNIKVV